MINGFLSITMAATLIFASPPVHAQTPEANPVEAGRRLISEGDLEGAVRTLRQAVSADPSNTAGWNALGAALNRLERYEEALEAARTAARLAPDDFGVQFNLGLVLWEVGRLEEAVAAHSRALTLRAGFAPALTERGGTLALLGRSQEAEADWRASLQADPTYIWAHYYRGLSAVTLGDHGRAAVELDRVVAEQNHPAAHLWRWIAYRRSGQPGPDLPEMTGWPSPIADYLEGRIDAAVLEAQAVAQALPIDQRRLASALFFIGQKRLADGDAGGLDDLRRALATDAPRHAERVSAESELKRHGA